MIATLALTLAPSRLPRWEPSANSETPTEAETMKKMPPTRQVV